MTLNPSHALPATFEDKKKYLQEAIRAARDNNGFCPKPYQDTLIYLMKQVDPQVKLDLPLVYRKLDNKGIKGAEIGELWQYPIPYSFSTNITLSYLVDFRTLEEENIKEYLYIEQDTNRIQWIPPRRDGDMLWDD